MSIYKIIGVPKSRPFKTAIELGCIITSLQFGLPLSISVFDPVG